MSEQVNGMRRYGAEDLDKDIHGDRTIGGLDFARVALELLDFRLNHVSGAFSIHQAIYDLLRQKVLPTIRNEKVREGFDQAWRTINSRYKPPVAA